MADVSPAGPDEGGGAIDPGGVGGMLCSDGDARLQRLINTPPAAVPRPGDVLHLAPGDIRWRADGMWVRVERVRPEISGCYDGSAVWLDVDELDASGTPVASHQLLVTTEAIARQQALVPAAPR
jgi:hypothetical protein